MLKLRDEQLTMWDAILPESVRALQAELAIIDELLDDERFLQPFVQLYPKGKKSGRPTFAIEKYEHLMVLKHKYDLGYESLVKEVGDSITWRMFCRIAIDEAMPDPSTLIYARKRYGDKIVEDVNAALVRQCEEKAILKTRKFRTDTTEFKDPTAESKKRFCPLPKSCVAARGNHGKKSTGLPKA